MSMETKFHFKYNPNIHHEVLKSYRTKTDASKPLYRYIPFCRFRDIIKTHKMWMGDVEKYWDDVYENFLHKEDINCESNAWRSAMRKRYYGMSWTQLEESDAMWRIYSDLNTCMFGAVKVKVSFKNLLNIAKKADIGAEIYPVAYVKEEKINDWLLKHSPMALDAFSLLDFECIFIKRVPFKHEQEIRLVIGYMDKNKGDSITLDIDDPNDFFEEIVADPRLADDKFDILKKELVDLGIDSAKIKKSTLYTWQPIALTVDLKEPYCFPYTEYVDGKPQTKYLEFEAPVK